MNAFVSNSPGEIGESSALAKLWNIFVFPVVRGSKPISFDIFEWLEIKGRLPFLLFIMNSPKHRTSFSQVCRPRSVDDNFRAIWCCKDSGLFVRFMMSARGESVSATVCTCRWFSNRKRQSAALSSTLINKAPCSFDRSDLWFPFDIFLSICVRCFSGDESASCSTIEKNSPNSALWKLAQKLIYLWVNRERMNEWHGCYKLLLFLFYKKTRKSSRNAAHFNKKSLSVIPSETIWEIIWISVGRLFPIIIIHRC